MEHPRQVAYIVTDLEAAIRDHARTFGSGPFFVSELDNAECVYRGGPGRINARFALGQWGDVQLEFIENLGDSPSVFRELEAPDIRRPVFHHVCVLPENQEEAVAEFVAQGMPVVHEFRTPVGTKIVIVDALEQHGFFIELHERTPAIEGVYANIRRFSERFDGERLIRPFHEAF
jgi:hypothetical protein